MKNYRLMAEAMETAKGIGSAFHNATAGIVVGGQILSLLLTLVAIPVFYSLFDDVIAWIRNLCTSAPKEQALACVACNMNSDTSE